MRVVSLQPSVLSQIQRFTTYVMGEATLATQG
jgi:hypothetical protein